MICVNVAITVKDTNDVAKVRQLLAEAARLSREEPGCERFDVYQSQSDATKFFLCEHWSTPDAHATHRTAQAYTTIYQPQVLPLVERVSHVCDIVS